MKSLRPNPADSIDHSMLDKLNRPGRRSGLSASVNDLPGARPNHAHLTTLSLPHRTKQPFLDSGFTRSPGAISATSPVNTPFGPTGRGSIADGGDFERSPLPRTLRINAGFGQDDGRDDEADFQMDRDETSRMRNLNIEDAWRDGDRDRDWEREREREGYQPGQKRRASSPPSDDAALANDILRRRDGGVISRGSPTPRLLVMPQNSLSSMSSVSRSGSYASNLTASSITSMGSFGRRSPIALSPGGLSPTDPVGCGSPYGVPQSLSASPLPSIGRSSAGPSPHHRTPSEQPMLGHSARSLVSPRKLAEIPKNSSSLAAKLKGPYMCECCPKKPKKFETEDELRYEDLRIFFLCFILSCCCNIPTRLPPLARLTVFISPFQQSARGREAVRVLVLRQPVQEQERSRAASKFPPRPAAQLVLFGTDWV